MDRLQFSDVYNVLLIPLIANARMDFGPVCERLFSILRLITETTAALPIEGIALKTTALLFHAGSA